MVGAASLEWTLSGQLHLARLDTYKPARDRYRGIGTALMHTLAHYAHHVAQKEGLSLWAIRPAIDFYRRLGFVEDHYRDCLRPDEGVWMKLDAAGIQQLLTQFR